MQLQEAVTKMANRNDSAIYRQSDIDDFNNLEDFRKELEFNRVRGLTFYHGCNCDDPECDSDFTPELVGCMRATEKKLFTYLCGGYSLYITRDDALADDWIVEKR